ncbi:Histone chaperone asf1 [Coemansia aciculifera]|nr:Histone chaperone asf1 [Coemansia aciculifera]
MRFAVVSLLIAFAAVATLAAPLPAPAADPIPQRPSGDSSPNRDWPVADKEFVRIGYYVDNAYTDEALLLTPPDVPMLDKIYRSILADKPRVTRFPINWDDPSKEEAPPVQPADGDMVDEDAMDADNQLNEDAVVGDNDEEDEGEEEEDDEEEEEEDEDENGEVDLAMSDEDDDAEEDEEEGINAAEDEDDEMMATDDPVAQHMVAHAGMSSATTMEVE